MYFLFKVATRVYKELLKNAQGVIEINKILQAIVNIL